MKILVASHTYIVELNREKLRELSKLHQNIEVIIIVPKVWQPGGVQNKIIESQPFKDGNFQVIPVDNFSKNNQGLLTFNYKILDILQKFKPDIIQVEQGVKSLAYAQLITINKLLNLKAKNVFFTWWNLPYNNKFPVNWLEKYNLNNTDGLIVGNQDGLDILREHGYQKDAIILPQLGVDETLFYPQKQPELALTLGISANDFIVGFVGRFVPEKGIITLLKALITIKELSWKFLLLGRGELELEIIKIAQENGIQDRLIIVESVAHDEVAKYINLMNTLVLPSETTYKFKTLTSVGWKEQFGHVLIEAMACKIPVIGSDSGEIPSVIGNTGLIFPEGNISALKNSLTQLIENEILREKLAQLGYEKCLKQYTNKALAAQQVNFYQQLLNI
jgi:glycosyltransferase involved in cell wall biosynthesis